jgi:hypothetical protein
MLVKISYKDLYLVNSRCLKTAYPFGPPLYSVDAHRSNSAERGEGSRVTIRKIDLGE